MGCSSSTQGEVEAFSTVANGAGTKAIPPAGIGGSGTGARPQPAPSKAPVPLSNGKEFFDLKSPPATTTGGGAKTTATGSGSAYAVNGSAANGHAPDSKGSAGATPNSAAGANGTPARPNSGRGGGSRAMTAAGPRPGTEKHAHAHAHAAGGNDSKSPSKSKRNHSLMRYTRSELMKMSRDQLSKMFDHYDKDKDGKLGPLELKRLARDVMKKVAELYGQRLRASQPDLSDADVADAYDKERKFLLPGDSDKDTIKQLSVVLTKTIDFVNGKTISKNVFMVQWGKAAVTVFPSQASEGDNAEMACVIL